jgi:hypothetical protein
MNNVVHRAANLAFFLTAGLTGLVGLVPRTMAAPPEARITAEQLREDIYFMRRTIGQLTPTCAFPPIQKP